MHDLGPTKLELQELEATEDEIWRKVFEGVKGLLTGRPAPSSIPPSPSPQPRKTSPYREPAAVPPSSWPSAPQRAVSARLPDVDRIRRGLARAEDALGRIQTALRLTTPGPLRDIYVGRLAAQQRKVDRLRTALTQARAMTASGRR